MASLLEKLKSDKKVAKLFKRSNNSIMLPTVFPVLDYMMGYKMKVDNGTDTPTIQNMLGIAGGSFYTFIGKSSTAKTTAAIQVAYSMVKDYEDGMVIHYDLEQATTDVRVLNVTGMNYSQYEEKYLLKQEDMFIEDIMDSIYAMCDIKEENRKELVKKSHLMNIRGEQIESFPPTVYILDSLPNLATKDAKAELEGGTYANRVAKALAQFYKKLTPIIKKYNITVICINHINAKIEINPMVKSAPQIMYLKQDESLPGGNASLYLANGILKFVAIGADKFNISDDGFDGFGVNIEVLKSRTNTNGKSFKMIYNKLTGFDPLRSLYEYAKSKDLLDGRNPKKYFKANPRYTFAEKNLNRDFFEEKELYRTLVAVTKPYLEAELSFVDTEEDTIPDEFKYLTDSINTIDPYLVLEKAEL